MGQWPDKDFAENSRIPPGSGREHTPGSEERTHHPGFLTVGLRPGPSRGLGPVSRRSPTPTQRPRRWAPAARWAGSSLSLACVSAACEEAPALAAPSPGGGAGRGRPPFLPGSACKAPGGSAGQSWTSTEHPRPQKSQVRNQPAGLFRLRLIQLQSVNCPKEGRGAGPCTSRQASPSCGGTTGRPPPCRREGPAAAVCPGQMAWPPRRAANGQARPSSSARPPPVSSELQHWAAPAPVVLPISWGLVPASVAWGPSHPLLGGPEKPPPGLRAGQGGRARSAVRPRSSFGL